MPELSILKLVGALDYSRNNTEGGKDKLYNAFLENEEWMILWDHTFSTDRSLGHTRPDLVFENKRTREGTIVEIGICFRRPANLDKSA